MRMMIAALLVLGLGGTALPAQEGNRAPAASVAAAAAPVNLNTATMAQLETLPGIGPATAQRIVDCRQQYSGFKKIEELMNVRGIGEVSFLKLKSLVTITPPRTERAAVQTQIGTARGRGGVRSSRPHAVATADRGYTFIEILFVTALIAVLSAIAVPSSLAMVDRARASAATRYLASRMAMARSHAVMRSANVALRFNEDQAGITFRMFVDSNRNGVRARDIAARVDQPLDAPASLSDLFPGVAIAVSGAAGSDPLRIGSSNLLSFTPLGTATSGSVYVRGRDGSQFAIRILGATGRVRVQRYEPRSGTWLDSF